MRTIVKVDHWSQEAKVLCYAYGLIDELQRAGLVTGGSWQISAKGRVVFQALKEDGFEPTKQEIKKAMVVIQAKYQHDTDAL